MFTRATSPLGFPKAPRIPVCNLSAPAHDNILLMRTTWYGWTRTRRWKPSFPATLTRYLLAQMRAASRASEDSCSYSLETRWMQSGKSSTFARLRPRSKIRILASGTPRLNLLLGYCSHVSLPASSFQNYSQYDEQACSCSSGSNGRDGGPL